MNMNYRKVWLIAGLLFLLSGCSSNISNKTKDSSNELGEVELKESRGNIMKAKVIDATSLGEKQQEGQLFREDFNQFEPYIVEIKKVISIPEEYELQEVQTGIQQNNEEIIRFRYGRGDQEVTLAGEHYSAVVRVTDKKLLGLMSIKEEAIIADIEDLPSKEETIDITRTFLNKVAPGFFEKLENLWVDRHDEPILINDEEQVVSGTKYKCYDSSEQEYAWVVVDKNGEVMIFERGVHWENNGRTTEKWLYDKYLNDGSLELFSVRRK